MSILSDLLVLQLVFNENDLLRDVILRIIFDEKRLRKVALGPIFNRLWSFLWALLEPCFGEKSRFPRVKKLILAERCEKMGIWRRSVRDISRSILRSFLRFFLRSLMGPFLMFFEVFFWEPLFFDSCHHSQAKRLVSKSARPTFREESGAIPPWETP